MAVNGKYEFATVTRADLIAEAGRWPLPAHRAARVIDDTLNRIGDAVDSALHEANAAGWAGPVLGIVADTIRRNVDRVRAS